MTTAASAGVTEFEVSTAIAARAAHRGAEVAIAVGAFVALCVAVLVRAPHLIEPDDFAYRASIVALTQGHITLTNAQYQALVNHFSAAAQPGIAQWDHLANGTWISEKNPGYPFFAAPFQLLGLLRLAPLFYGALACLGLFFGGRRWLGRYGGAWAVALYCSSGAALVFAWRATMPTFTDASLIAAGTGALLWALLATDASTWRRDAVGLLAFLAFEGAAFIRYTNLVVLAVAVASVLLARRQARLTRRSLLWWLGSVALFGVLVATFDDVYYGGITKTGYSAGEIQFGLSAVVPNVEHMPSHLVWSMPLLVLALAAAGWIGVRAALSRSLRRDDAVAAALIASWIGIYGLYSAYTWTVSLSERSGTTLQVVRFYLPALGAVSLFAAWLLSHLPRWLPIPVLVVLATLAAFAYPSFATGHLGGPGGGAGFGGPPNGIFPGGPGSSGGPPGLG
jgi:hypothetical protein